MPNMLNLSSIQVNSDGEQSAVRTIRLPAEFLKQVHNHAAGRGKTVNRVLAQAAMLGFKLLEQQGEKTT